VSSFLLLFSIIIKLLSFNSKFSQEVIVESLLISGTFIVEQIKFHEK